MRTSDSEMLENEMLRARRHVIECRESGDDGAAELSVLWMNLLLEEWERQTKSAVAVSSSSPRGSDQHF